MPSIKARLKECYSVRKPVLLHSDSSTNVFNRAHLIEEFHKKETGCKQLYPVEFIKTEDVPNGELLIKELGGKLNKALIDEYTRRNKKTINTRTAAHECDKIDKNATDSRIDLQRAQLVAQGFDVPEEPLDILGDMADLWKFDVFRIEAGGILMQWQNQTPKNQLLVEIENKVREHFKSTAKSYCEIDFTSDKGKDVYSFLVQKNVVDNIEILHDPVISKPFFSVPIYESYLLDFKGTIFLNNLECDRLCSEDDKYYLEIADIIRQKPGCWVIAYAQNPEVFSREFTAPYVFKSIRLSDIGVSSVTEDKNGERKILGFAESTRRSSDKETVSFPTPHNSKWTEVEMFLIDKDHFKIIIKPIEKVVTYSQMGFKKEKSIIKTKLWGVLLRFATANNSQVGYYAEKTEVEKDIQRLNVVLIRYFGITGNPIKLQGDKKGYVAEFKIYDNSYLQEHMNSKQQVISEEERLDEKIDKDINDSSA